MIHVGFLAITFISLSVLLPAAYGQTSGMDQSFSFGFFVKKLTYDVSEAFTFDPVKKAELKIKHANEIDSEIQARINTNQIIPQQMIDLQQTKLTEARGITDNPQHGNVFDHVKSILNSAFDKSELRQIQADFGELRHEQNQERKAQLAQALNDKINRPSINIACMNRIDANEISQAQNPYQALQEKCQILKLVPESSASGILD